MCKDLMRIKLCMVADKGKKGATPTKDGLN